MNISSFSNATLDIFVCTDCGYVHTFLLDEGKIEEVKKKWPHVDE